MELSTIIPSVTIRAARVTVFSSMPNVANMPIDMNMVTGMVDAAIRATRNGSRSITTMITAITAITNSCRKLVTLSSTTLLWSVMRSMLTSDGSSCLKSSITLFTSLPISTMLQPFFISMLSNTHL